MDSANFQAPPMVRPAFRLPSMIRDDVVTRSTPEAIRYMDETGGSFEDFLFDECFVCELFGVPFLNEHRVDSGDHLHTDAQYFRKSREG